MQVKQEFLQKIKDYFDLNIYETKVWLALLAKGIASAGQVAELSSVPRSRTYDVLEGLEKKGFAIVKLGKPVRYIGIKPQMILEKMKNNVRNDAEERVMSLSNLKSTEEFLKLEEIYKQGVNPIKREEISVALKGRLNISNHLNEVLRNASQEVIICTNAIDVHSKITLFKQTLEILNKGNIKIKIALSGDEKLIKKISNELNTKIKKIDIDAKFFIVDRKEIMFYISKGSKNLEGEKRDKQGSDEVAIWVNSEFFAKAFATLFDNVVK